MLSPYVRFCRFISWENGNTRKEFLICSCHDIQRIISHEVAELYTKRIIMMLVLLFDILLRNRYVISPSFLFNIL